jgi:zearalenone synthase (nonreducing iterative type I polyketide synthase)
VVEDFERHEDKDTPADPRSAHVVVLSAHTAASHRANKSRLAKWLRANPTARLEDVAYTTTARRVHQPSFRFACAASSTKELAHSLESDVNSAPAGPQPITSKSPVVFVFTGQGSHYAGMGAELYRSTPVFRDTVDLCGQICDGFGFPPFLEIITGTAVGTDDDKPAINATPNSKWNTSQTQLALVTLQIGLANFWRRLGIEPALVMGHSLGEYAALHVAGVLSLADALYLVGSRAALAIQKCRPVACAMLAVSAAAADLRDMIKALGLGEDRGQQSCSIACTNSPSASVLSGTVFAVARVQAELKKRNIRTKMLPLPFGFHSSQVDAILDDFKAIASGPGITYSPPKVPVASTMLGSIIDAQTPAAQGFGPEYLAKQTRNPVDFVGALFAVQAWGSLSKANGDPSGAPVWLEMGPGQVCASFVQETLSPPAGHVVSSMSAAPSKSSWASISDCLASLYAHGCDPDWLLLHAPFEHNLRLVTLPSYAWDVKDFWIKYQERKHSGMQTATNGTGLTPTQPISTCAQYVVDKATKDGRIHVTLGASLAHPALLALIQGHRMQDMGICSGSVFCEAAFVAAKCALEHSGRQNIRVGELSLHKAHLRRPLTASLVGPEGELHTAAVIESESHVLVSFKAVSRSGSPARSFDLGECAVVVSKGPALALESSDSFYIRARMHEVTRTCSSRLPSSIFYALFSSAVQYGSDNYRCVREVFVLDDFSEAVAEVVLAADPPGLLSVASSPYWGEALAHLAGFLVNCHPGRFAGAAQAATSFIMDSLERFEQAPGSIEPGRAYFTYARVLEKKADTAVCEVVVFDDKDRVVMRTWRMRFHEVPNTMLQALLPGLRKERNAVLLQPPEASASLLPDPPELAVPNMPDGITYNIQVTEKETETQQSVFLEDGIGPRDPSPGSLESPSGLLPVILESIAEETGLPDTSELTDDASLTDLGVDSIMAVEICARIKAKSGHQLSPSFILEHPTIGHLSRVFGGGVTDHQQVGQQEHEEYQVAMHDPERRKEDDVATKCHDTEVVAKGASTSSSSPSPTPAHTPPPESASHEPVETNEPQPKARIMLLQQRRPQPGAPCW